MTAITPDELLASTSAGCGFHDWSRKGGTIQVTTDELRPVLEEAYDPSMPDWPNLITWDDEDGFFAARPRAAEPIRQPPPGIRHQDDGWFYQLNTTDEYGMVKVSYYELHDGKETQVGKSFHIPKDCIDTFIRALEELK